MRRLSAGLLIAALAGAALAGPMHPDDLDALLAELEASGGILTDADLAALALPEATPSRGSWELALGARDKIPPRADLRAAWRSPRWSFRIRARRQAGADRVTGWVSTRMAGLNVAAGGGALVHGAGLLAAPPGRRRSLSAASSLLPSRPGWRPSTASAATAGTVDGVAVGWSGGTLQLAAGAARDGEDRPSGHLRAGVRAAGLRLGAAALRRGDGRGVGIDLDWRRGAWRLAVDVTRWRLGGDGGHGGDGRAWHMATQWRGERWRVEGQAAQSRATDGLDGAARPACLPGWRGRGWALRLVGRPTAGLTVSLVHGRGEARDPEVADGRRERRSLLGLRVRGRLRGGAVGELRLRRVHEQRHGRDPLQPWRPAALEWWRLRTWLTLAIEAPVERGEAALTWRWLEEGGRNRQLLAAVWTRQATWGRWRAGLHLAWGAPLDLVAVSAPAPGLVRLRHWGFWRSGLLLGLGGGRAWRWELAGELRRGAAGSGRGLFGEFRAAWGRSF